MNKFKKWLIENYGQDCWDEFKNALKSGNEYKSVKELFKSYNKWAIQHAFFWYKTTNGWQYWFNIHKAWVHHLESKK